MTCEELRELAEARRELLRLQGYLQDFESSEATRLELAVERLGELAGDLRRLEDRAAGGLSLDYLPAVRP